MDYKNRLLIIIIVVLACCEILRADSFGINIYGLSYHTGNNVRKYIKFNEVNSGIGFRADFGSLKGNSFFIEGGKYNDSFNNDAKYISIAYQFRMWHQLRVGINTALYNTKSTNQGKSFLAPIPMMSYRVWRVSVNTVYLPKYERINPFYVFGAYLTINIVQNDR